MSNPKAEFVRAPQDDVTADDFGVREYTVATSVKRNAVPSEWSGSYVSIYSATGMRYAFSFASDATVVQTPSATDAGAASQVGGVIAAGERRDVHLPVISAGATLYFVRAGAAGAATLELSSRS